MYVEIYQYVLYVDRTGSFLFYNGTMDIFDEKRHLFKVIDYPYIQSDHYSATMTYISPDVGRTASWILCLDR